jgi:hypothetical protein
MASVLCIYSRNLFAFSYPPQSFMGTSFHGGIKIYLTKLPASEQFFLVHRSLVTEWMNRWVGGWMDR